MVIERVDTVPMLRLKNSVIINNLQRSDSNVQEYSYVQDRVQLCTLSSTVMYTSSKESSTIMYGIEYSYVRDRVHLCTGFSTVMYGILYSYVQDLVQLCKLHVKNRVQLCTGSSTVLYIVQ